MKQALTGWIVGAMTLLGGGAFAQATFGDDVAFLKQHTGVIVLKDASGQGQVAVIPAYQARVITSSAAGAAGSSFGWVNRELISSGKLTPHINVFGGEDRFWLGPEGGQFSLFFKKGAKFNLQNWQTPAPIDSEPYDVVSTSSNSVLCRKRMRLTNYSNTSFDVLVNREIMLRDPAVVLNSLGVQRPSGLKAVAFSTVNTIRNAGAAAWTKDSGLLSIWILGMFNASPKTTIVVPYQIGSEAERGVVVHDTYFGKVPSDRLIDDDGVLFFRADAKFRSKIGIPPKRAKSVMGSYDASSHTLTLVIFSLPGDTTDYVNSMWEIQKEPFAGDVANSYNDGPSAPGAKQLGQFYELESSSPALALKPGQSAVHVQTTLHLQGDPKRLDEVAVAVLGRGIEKIVNAFAR